MTIPREPGVAVNPSAELGKLERTILNTIAAKQSDTGADVAQGDVRLMVLDARPTREQRQAVDEAFDALTPRLLARHGLPASPMLTLTAEGWLRSERRPQVARLAQVFLDTYRSLAVARRLHGRQVTWEDLSKCGMEPGFLGLFHTAGRQLYLFVEGTVPGMGASPDSLSLPLPWDIDELLHLETAEEFFEYRLANPLHRVNFFQRIHLRLTGEIQRSVDTIYAEARQGWPYLRSVEVALRRNGDHLLHAIRGGFATVLGSGQPDARVALSYLGLRFAKRAEPDRALIVKTLRGLAAAYEAAPMVERVPGKATLVAAGVSEDFELDRVIALLEGQSPWA